MANVRDPAFWKRFSVAVHMDEEQAQRPDLKHQDSWLGRQNAKRSRRTRICWAFWLCFLIFIAAVVAGVIWMLQSGVLDGDGEDSGQGDASTD